MISNPAIFRFTSLVKPNLNPELNIIKVFPKNYSSVLSCFIMKNKIGTFKDFPSLSKIIKKRGVHDLVSDIRFIDFNDKFTKEEEDLIVKNMIVIESFINEDEESYLLKEIEPYMKRLRYEFSHWDDAIHGYRETERLKWNEENTKIINRVRNFAFPPGSPHLGHVHILDLAEDGFIKPHIDAVRFCGNTIAGLSLLTDAVMRLVHDKDKTKIIDVLLKRRSLYVMRDCVRYDYTHEILAKPVSKFKNQLVEKKRRISVICRNEPNRTVKSPDNDNKM